MVERVTIAGLQAQLEAVNGRLEALGNFFATAAPAALGTVEGEDAVGLAMRAFSHVEAERAAAAGQVDDLGRFLIAKNRGAPIEGKPADAAIALIVAQEGTIGQLGNSLKAYKGSATRARNDAAVLKAQLSPEARPIGAWTGPAGSADEIDVQRRRARTAFENARRDGPIQIVFSDGKREVREIAPLIVAGDAWRVDARGFTLNDQPVLEPGAMGKPEVSIAGVAALDEAGEQVGWQRWVEPVKVPSNGRVQLTAGHIRFSF